MRICSRVLLALATVAAVLAAMVANAGANRMSVSSLTFREVFTDIGVESSAGTVRCPVTSEGSFHSAISNKTEGALAGFISRASVNNAACSNGHMTIEQANLPWHIAYGGFMGSLPRISGTISRLIGTKVRIELGGLTCTTGETEEHPGREIANIGAGGAVIGLRMDEGTSIPLRSGFLCEIAGEGRLVGTGTVTVLGNTSAITVTLI